MSGSLARCEGGAAAPLSILAMEQILAQKSCFPKAGINFNSFGPFSEFFFSKNHKNIDENWKPTKNCKKWAKILNFVIFEQFQHAIPQKKHFSHRIQFHTEKVWFFSKKIEKIKFFRFFFQNRCWPLFSSAQFSNLCQKTSKLSSSVLWRVFEIKTHQRRTHYV